MTEEQREWYKRGALAERKRCIRLALNAMTYNASDLCHTISDDGHAIAQMISKAKNKLPLEIPRYDHWSVFGERKLVRNTTTHLEREYGPFTKHGLDTIRDLEEEVARLLKRRLTGDQLRARIKKEKKKTKRAQEVANFYAQMLRDLGLRKVPLNT